MKKSVSVILLATILLQSCVAYQKSSVSLSEAQNQGSVKVTTTSGEQFEFTNIYVKDSLYYGVAKTQDLLLDTSQIINIYLKDVKKSKSYTAWVIIGGVVTIAIVGWVIGVYIWAAN